MRRKYSAVILSTALLVSLMLFSSYRVEISEFLGYSRAALSNYGSTGQEVIDIQSKLYNWGYYNGIVDGIYGYETYSAVKKFQAKNGWFTG